MPDSGRLVRVVHAIPGRLRLRLEGQGWSLESMEDLVGALEGLRRAPGITELRLTPEARSAVIRYDQRATTAAEILAAVTAAGATVSSADQDPTDPRARLQRLPLRLDRRLLGSLAISGVSLYAARQVGAALGGATTLPAYFVIWFALRRAGDLANRWRDPPSDIEDGRRV